MVMTAIGLNEIRDWFGSQANSAPTHLVIGEGGEVIDNFNSYGSDAALQAAWPQNEGTVTRDTTTPKEGAVTCIWTTNAAPATDPYIEHTIADEDWTIFEKIKLWFKTSDASKIHQINIRNNGVWQTAYDFKAQLFNDTWIYVEITLTDTTWTYDDVERIRFIVDDAEWASSGTFYLDSIDLFSPDPQAADTAIAVELTRLTFSETPDTSTSQEVSFKAFLPSTDVPTLGKILRRMGLNNAASGGTQFTHRKHADLFKTNAIDVSYEIQIRFQEVV